MDNMKAFELFLSERDRADSQNKEILNSIGMVRLELSAMRAYGTHEQQLECFKRLLGLYASLNAEVGLVDVAA